MHSSSQGAPFCLTILLRCGPPLRVEDRSLPQPQTPGDPPSLAVQRASGPQVEALLAATREAGGDVEAAEEAAGRAEYAVVRSVDLAIRNGARGGESRRGSV